MLFLGLKRDVGRHLQPSGFGLFEGSDDLFTRFVGCVGGDAQLIARVSALDGHGKGPEARVDEASRPLHFAEDQFLELVRGGVSVAGARERDATRIDPLGFDRKVLGFRGHRARDDLSEPFGHVELRGAQ